jgi:nicotinamidase/pyrazinamidase
MPDAGPMIFIDVDTQRDFLEPTGALYIPGAEQIVPNLALLSTYARTHNVPILATADAHSLDEPDPEPFPPHCLVGSAGQHRHDATRPPHPGHVLGLNDRFDPSQHPHLSLPDHLTIEKRRYDVFSHPDASRVVAHYRRIASAASGGVDPTFVIYGVATDYCIRALVEGLLARNAHVAVVVDAIRAIDPAAEPILLTDWARRGVVLVRTERLCGSSDTAPACPPAPADRKMPA